ncbi:MAG: NADH-quinone oxidoreductase subunit I [Armatimonadota bacterium]
MLEELFKGLAVTMRHVLGEKRVTVEYPEVKRQLPPRARWRHVLLRHEDGLERCIGCSLCAGACPAHCILVVAAENREGARYSPGERYAQVYEINMLRCIFCGYCQDACPVEAVVLRDIYEISEYTRDAEIHTKDMLLLPYP